MSCSSSFIPNWSFVENGSWLYYLLCHLKLTVFMLTGNKPSRGWIAVPNVLESLSFNVFTEVIQDLIYHITKIFEVTAQKWRCDNIVYKLQYSHHVLLWYYNVLITTNNCASLFNFDLYEHNSFNWQVLHTIDIDEDFR